MKIINLSENSRIYTSNAYLVLGTWNAVEDVNTLIDTGSDLSVIDMIDSINTGLGKRKINQVILTHSHSDHMAALGGIIERYNPAVFAFNPFIKGVNNLLKDNDIIKIGDRQFEVFHITSHSYDSVCLYGWEDGALFSGDTSFPIEFENETLRKENEPVLKRLKSKNIITVYPGHGPPCQFKTRPFKLLKDK
jgi:glyoxylase-like metal-dependent hydrolase (beta-lactamase superfamily II)